MKSWVLEVWDLAPESQQTHAKVLTHVKQVLACKHVRMTLAMYLQSTALSESIMPGLMELHSSKCFLSCGDYIASIPSGFSEA